MLIQRRDRISRVLSAAHIMRSASYGDDDGGDKAVRLSRQESKEVRRSGTGSAVESHAVSSLR